MITLLHKESSEAGTHPTIYNVVVLALFFIYLLLPISAIALFAFDPIPTIIGRVLLSIFVYLLSLMLATAITNTLLSIFCVVLLNAVYMFILLLDFVSFYFQGISFNDSFFYHLSFDIFLEFVANHSDFSLPLIGYLCLGIAISIMAFFGFRKFYFLKFKVCFALVPLFFLSCFTSNSITSLHFCLTSYTSFFPAISDSSTNTSSIDKSLLLQYNIDTEVVPINELIAKPGSNLILIYLESLELSYMNNTTFPGLVPNISKMFNTGLSFSNINQFRKTGWTIGGIYASHCGLPLFVGDFGGNDMNMDVVSFNQVCLGDILNRAGYYQIYLGGARTSFAGKDSFLKSHGYDEVLGFKELKHKMPRPDYKANWGLYDDTLFDIAFDKYISLSDSGKPFNLTILTLDTHAPHGHPSESCPKYITQNEALSSNSMLDAIHCTDFLLGSFMNRVSKLKSQSNTVVWIMSDHLAMRNDTSHLLPKSWSERRLLAFSPNNSNTINDTLGSHFDITPTLLKLLKVDTNANFHIGKNLLENPIQDRLKALKDNDGMLLLSRIASSMKKKVELCGSGGIKTDQVNNHFLFFNDIRIRMSYKGNLRIPKGIFFVAVARDNEVYFTGMKERDKVGELLAKSPEDTFLLIGKNIDMPQHLYDLLPRDRYFKNKWQVFVGSPDSSKKAFFKTFDKWHDIKISRKQCLSVLATKS